MGNCLRGGKNCDNCNDIDKYLLQNQENIVKLYSKEMLIEYEGQLNCNGQYEGYGKEYDHINDTVKDGLFSGGVFVTGYIKYFRRNWSLEKIEYYDDGRFIRVLY